jgi:hypothetical protein
LRCKQRSAGVAAVRVHVYDKSLTHKFEEETWRGGKRKRAKEHKRWETGR